MCISGSLKIMVQYWFQNKLMVFDEKSDSKDRDSYKQELWNAESTRFKPVTVNDLLNARGVY